MCLGGSYTFIYDSFQVERNQSCKEDSNVESVGPVFIKLGEEKCFGKFFCQFLWLQRRYDDSDDADDGE